MLNNDIKKARLKACEYTKDACPSTYSVFQLYEKVIKQFEQKEKKLLETINRIRKINKKILLKNYEMRKLLLEHGIDYDGAMEKLLQKIFKDN